MFLHHRVKVYVNNSSETFKWTLFVIFIHVGHNKKVHIGFKEDKINFGSLNNGH